MLTRTTTALLDDLRDPANEAVWQEFDRRYRPVLVGFARRLGLAAEDAADIAQETLIRFVKAHRAGQYDRTRGRLHSWIIGIARNCIVDQRRSAASRRHHRGMSAIVDLPGDDDLDALWDAQFQEAMLQEGVAELRRETRIDPKTIRAFELLAFEGRSATNVAEEMGITTNDVYLAKSRCLKRLRGILDELRELYEVA